MIGSRRLGVCLTFVAAFIAVPACSSVERDQDLKKTHGREIQSILSSLQPRFKTCLQPLAAKQLKRGLKIVVDFIIEADGRVLEAALNPSSTSRKIAACLIGVVKDTEFPKPPNGGTADVSYPVTFRLK